MIYIGYLAITSFTLMIAGDGWTVVRRAC